MIVRDDYLIFTTKHSDGQDFCIMDSCGRFSLIHVDDVEDFIVDLSHVLMNDDGMSDLDNVKSNLRAFFPDD